MVPGHLAEEAREILERGAETPENAE